MIWEMRKCAQARNLAQGEPLPKREIVDTTFHASCAPRLGKHSETVLPTLWEWDRVRSRGSCETIIDCFCGLTVGVIPWLIHVIVLSCCYSG